MEMHGIYMYIDTFCAIKNKLCYFTCDGKCVAMSVLFRGCPEMSTYSYTIYLQENIPTKLAISR